MIAFAVLLPSLIILSLIYFNRILTTKWTWEWYIIIFYGLVVTPFLIFRLTVAHAYSPLPDLKYRPTVSVIIPAYNEEKVIRSAVDALLTSDYPKMEIFVVDDGSTDKTYDVIKDIQGINIIRQENRGKRHAIATGVEHSHGKIIVCVDSDTVVTPCAIRFLVQPLIDPDVYCVCGNGVAIDQTTDKMHPHKLLVNLQKVWYAESFRVRKGVESQYGMVICCSGVLSAYRADKFKSMIDVWLNEKFMGREVVAGDDRQMTNLMLKMGGRSVYQSNAMAYTFTPQSMKKFLKQQLRWGRSAFRGMIFASTFFWKKKWSQKLVFYATMFTNLFSPISLVINTIFFALIGRLDWVALYLFGLTILSIIFSFNDMVMVDYFTWKNMVHRVLFTGVSIAITYMYMYAWITPWKGKRWGTR